MNSVHVRDDVPLLLTPGPLTTAPEVRAATHRDWGSREGDFVALTRRLRARLVQLAGGSDRTCIPVQGSGTYAVEAMLGSFVPADGKVLILVNGAYGRRMAEICQRIGRAHRTMIWAEDEVVDAAALETALREEAGISHVAVVHLETTSGILNPLAAIAATVASHGRRLLVDAMSSFGAVPIASDLRIDALAASANKGLEGLPGLSFVLARPSAIGEAAGRAPSLALDLHDQWRSLETSGEWRFTPPTHIVAALDRALDLLDAEGGIAARHRRYQANMAALRRGMERLGFHPYLAEERSGPVIATFHWPSPTFDFVEFHARLLALGFAIYPGKLTAAPSFRVGCIGQVTPDDIERFLAAVAVIFTSPSRSS